jgi:hypothetical protein
VGTRASRGRRQGTHAGTAGVMLDLSDAAVEAAWSSRPRSLFSSNSALWEAIVWYIVRLGIVGRVEVMRMRDLRKGSGV